MKKKNQCSHITDQVLPNTEINITLSETCKRNDAIIRVMHTRFEDESYNFFKFRSVMIYNRLQQIFLCLGGFAVSFSSPLSKYPWYVGSINITDFLSVNFQTHLQSVCSTTCFTICNYAVPSEIWNDTK